VQIIGDNANLELVDKFCHSGDMFSADGDADVAVETRIHTYIHTFNLLKETLKQ